MKQRAMLIAAASMIAITGEAVAQQASPSAASPPAQESAVAPDPSPGVAASEPEEIGGDIVVTGIRNSLERAAEIKQNAIQVVDSIVAQDIGKLPDPTTAAALQRVPGIQVSVTRNNELGDVRVRGLPDVLTTVNGREVFTTTGRNFDLQDLPAEALARVDVYKSQTPDLIEGGLAGVIDLKLNKPLAFKKPTAVISARGNYGKRVDRFDPQVGLLLANQWNTSIGEIGVLVNGTYSNNHYRRDNTVLFGLRSGATAPLNTPGVLVPNIMQNFPEEGEFERAQANAAVQWKPTDSLELYVDGLYTRFHDRGARYGANVQAFVNGASLSNVQLTDDCYDARATGAGQNPNIVVNPTFPVGDPRRLTLQANTVQRLCYIDSATLNNPVVNLTTQARDISQVNRSMAGGAIFERDGSRFQLDVSYQKSRGDRRNVIADIGRRLSTFTFRPNVNDVAQFETDGAALLDGDALFIRNSLQQGFGLTLGDLFSTKFDAEHKLDGFISRIKAGARYARRAADSFDTLVNTPIPGGNIGTGSEATAVLVRNTGLSPDFLTVGSPAPGINGGAPFVVPNPDFLLSDSGLDALRTYFRLPTGRPAFQRDRQFNASEKSFATYAQAEYEVPIGSATLDGLVGARFVKTDRTIETFRATTAGGVTTFTPIAASATDNDFLPTATARLKLDNGMQARLGYQRSIRRPIFSSLNPAVTLNLSNNPLVQSTGSAGNPDLLQQKSDSYDGTLEYYFPSGYVALAGYYRQISNRVITSPQVETINGVDYNVTRPRNLGEATLKGLELSGQYFFDFLPGGFSGIGLQGAFTLADSEIGGNDPLAGNPLQGVSKYNYTAGLLYDKFGISGRLVYTYRSRYFDTDNSGSISVRPIESGRASEVFVPTLLSYVRPAGRLDFNVGYDISPALRIDVGGVNILRNKTRSYLGQAFQSNEGFYDETTYSIGIRYRL